MEPKRDESSLLARGRSSLYSMTRPCLIRAWISGKESGRKEDAQREKGRTFTLGGQQMIRELFEIADEFADLSPSTVAGGIDTFESNIGRSHGGENKL